MSEIKNNKKKVRKTRIRKYKYPELKMEIKNPQKIRIRKKERPKNPDSRIKKNPWN